MNEDTNDAIEARDSNLTLSGVFYGETVFYTPLPDLPVDLHNNFTCTPFLRFFDDGVVISIIYDHDESDITNIWSNDMNEWFHHEYENRGTYYLSDTNIEFFVECHVGIVEYKGNYVEGQLILISYSHINGNCAANLKYIKLTDP